MAKKVKDEPVDGVKATRTLAGKTETRTFSKEHVELIGTDAEHNGGWQLEEPETPAELTEGNETDPQL